MVLKAPETTQKERTYAMETTNLSNSLQTIPPPTPLPPMLGEIGALYRS